MDLSTNDMALHGPSLLSCSMDFTTRRFTIVVHAIFWAFYLLASFSSYSKFVGLESVYVKVFLSASVHAALVYIHHFILLRRFFLKRKFALYMSIMIPLFYGAVALLVMIEKNWFVGQAELGDLLNWQSFGGAFVSCFIVVSLTALLTFLQEWSKQQELNNELVYDQLQAEHKLLRMQVNPHFLFNALNNIYALAFKKSDETAPAVLKLADLMRYMVYESDVKSVSLVNEVKYIENYIGLQELKFGEDASKIEFTQDNISPVQVDPILFIPFVENAFKHGNLADENAYIKVHIELRDYTLNFSCINTFDPKDRSKDDVGGVGVSNVISRLKAHYPQRHDLKITKLENEYRVLLTIQI